MSEVELPQPEELLERAADRFGRGVALVTAVYAVMLALASLGGFTLLVAVPFMEPGGH